MRIGHGYDVHRLVSGRSLVLGGVRIEYSLGLLGHSDADVLVHAVMDALLGACGWGDIGKLFPDTDPAYKNADSMELLRTVMKRLLDASLRVDVTVIAQRPKLAPYLDEVRANLAKALCVAEDRVNVKATTEEGLGFTGRGEGIAAHAVALILEQWDR